MGRRLRALLLGPLLALDCLANMACGGSIRHTLSGEAWRQREHKYWGWTHRFIDAMFFLDPNHCRDTAISEALYGSIWTAWVAQVKGQA